MSHHSDDDEFNQLAQLDEDQDVNLESCELITNHFRKRLEQNLIDLQQEYKATLHLNEFLPRYKKRSIEELHLSDKYFNEFLKKEKVHLKFINNEHLLNARTCFNQAINALIDDSASQIKAAHTSTKLTNKEELKVYLNNCYDKMTVSGSSVIDFKEKIVNETIKWFSDKLNTVRVREDLLFSSKSDTTISTINIKHTTGRVREDLLESSKSDTSYSTSNHKHTTTINTSNYTKTPTTIHYGTTNSNHTTAMLNKRSKESATGQYSDMNNTRESDTPNPKKKLFDGHQNSFLPREHSTDRYHGNNDVVMTRNAMRDNTVTPFNRQSGNSDRNINRQINQPIGNNCKPHYVSNDHQHDKGNGRNYKVAREFNIVTQHMIPSIAPTITQSIHCITASEHSHSYDIDSTLHHTSMVTYLSPSITCDRSTETIRSSQRTLRKRRRKGARNIITEAYRLLRQHKRLPKFCQLITNKGIHNLSLKKLSVQEEAILSLGLKFIIKPPPNLRKEIFNSYSNFVRSIRLKNQFLGCNTLLTGMQPSIRIPNKSFIPSKAGKALENYITEVRYKLLENLQSVQKDMYAQHKVPKIFTITINTLKKDSSILICNADKNLGICIVDREWYEKEALRQLQNNNTYMKIPIMPHMDIFISRIIQILDKHKKDNIKLREYFLQNCRKNNSNNNYNGIGRFYLTIKIHKTPLTGRPIVATVDSFTYYISKFLDSILQRVLKTLPSYLRNTNDLILFLESQSQRPNLPNGYVLYTADIKDMYPSININDGLIQLKEAILEFNAKQNEQNKIECELIIDLAEFVLKNNYFIFGSNTYWLQMSGTAMGTPLAVTFACIYINQLEQLTIKRLKDNGILFNEICLYYRRYIDDIFAIFTSEEAASQFLATFNQMRPGRIELITTHIGKSVTFMDLDIIISSATNKIYTRIYQKPKNAYLYLPPSSFHQKHIFTNTITAELRRYKLKCFLNEDYCNIKNEFYNRLLTRGYGKDYLDPIFLKEELVKRSTLINNLMLNSNNNNKTTGENMPVTFSITNTPLLRQFNFSKLLQLTEELESDPIHPLIFPTYKGRNKPIVTYKRAENMRDLLTRSAYLHPLQDIDK